MEEGGPVWSAWTRWNRKTRRGARSSPEADLRRLRRWPTEVRLKGAVPTGLIIITLLVEGMGSCVPHLASPSPWLATAPVPRPTSLLHRLSWKKSVRETRENRDDILATPSCKTALVKTKTLSFFFLSFFFFFYKSFLCFFSLLQQEFARILRRMFYQIFYSWFRL